MNSEAVEKLVANVMPNAEDATPGHVLAIAARYRHETGEPLTELWLPIEAWQRLYDRGVGPASDRSFVGSVGTVGIKVAGLSTERYP